MKLIKHILFCSLLFLGLPGSAAARQMPESILRVGLLVRTAAFNISCDGTYYLYELGNGNQKDITPLDDTIVRCSNNRIILQGAAYQSPIRIVPGEQGRGIRINGRRYRDSILITIQNGSLTVINELGIEDYLRGVLKMEADPGWSQEALKVQAVISRTYMMRNLRKHGQDGFDVCAKTHCQVYGGMESEDERCTKAVEATRGEVLTYEGELAQTLFHASCAGHTENPNDVWSWDRTAPRYLQGIRDNYCKGSPHGKWSNSLGAETICKRLNAAGYKIGKIRGIKLSGTTGSGRVSSVVIYHKKGTLKISAAKFRLAAGPDVVRSTYIRRVEKEGVNYRFSGRGWGHGVGLCQWGAREMAEQGSDYRKILSHYYPGTMLERWEE